MKKIRKAFSLLEVLIGVLLLSLICLFLFPSLYTNLEASYRSKDDANLTFILQEALETNRDMAIGRKTQIINGKEIDISVESYENQNFNSNKYKKIKASFGDKSLELIEVDNDEEEGL